MNVAYCGCGCDRADQADEMFWYEGEAFINENHRDEFYGVTERLAEIDSKIAEITAMFGPKKDWEPTETHPVKRQHQIQDHNQRLETMATQVRLGGGQVKPDYYYTENGDDQR